MSDEPRLRIVRPGDELVLGPLPPPPPASVFDDTTTLDTIARALHQGAGLETVIALVRSSGRECDPKPDLRIDLPVPETEV